jgi:copper chaperone CopZ
MDRDENLQRLVIELVEIPCAGCAMDVENILLDTDGVDEAEVKYADGLVTIDYCPDIINEKELFIKVRKLGLKARVVS